VDEKRGCGAPFRGRSLTERYRTLFQLPYALGVLGGVGPRVLPGQADGQKGVFRLWERPHVNHPPLMELDDPARRRLGFHPLPLPRE
jgi:hypothetical protein